MDVAVVLENSYFDESLAKTEVVVIIKWMRVIFQSVWWDFTFMILICVVLVNACDS